MMESLSIGKSVRLCQTTSGDNNAHFLDKILRHQNTPFQ